MAGELETLLFVGALAIVILPRLLGSVPERFTDNDYTRFSDSQ